MGKIVQAPAPVVMETVMPAPVMTAPIVETFAPAPVMSAPIVETFASSPMIASAPMPMTTGFAAAPAYGATTYGASAYGASAPIVETFAPAPVMSAPIVETFASSPMIASAPMPMTTGFAAAPAYGAT